MEQEKTHGPEVSSAAGPLRGGWVSKAGALCPCARCGPYPVSIHPPMEKVQDEKSLDEGSHRLTRLKWQELS